MKKVYSCLQDLNLSTNVQINGKSFPINFTNGFQHPFRRNGRFSTADEEVQKAIESDSSYGKEFTEIDSSGQPIIKKSKGVKTDPPPTGSSKTEKTEGNTGEQGDSDPDFHTVGDEVKNFQAAKSWLITNKGALPEQVANKELVLKFAKESKVKFQNVK